MPGPQIGERRQGASETVEWDGKRWNPVDESHGYQPNLADSEHPWLARLKGFLSGAAEAATPAKLGTLAALATDGVSIPAQMATAGGAEALSELLQVATGSKDAPQSFGDAATRAAVSSGLAGVLGGAGKAYGAIRDAGGPINSALDVASHLPVVGKYAQAARALRGLMGDAGSAASSELQPLAQSVRASREVPYAMPAAEKFADSAEHVTSGGSFHPVTGNYVRPGVTPTDIPRLNKVPSVNETLTNALEGLRGPESPSVVSKPLMPGETITPGGNPSTAGDWTPGDIEAARANPLYRTDKQVAGEGWTSPSMRRTNGESMVDQAVRLRQAPSADVSSAPATPVDRLGQAIDNLMQRQTGAVTEPKYTDWAQQMDDIINAAHEENSPELARQSGSRWSKKQYERAGYKPLLTE